VHPFLTTWLDRAVIKMASRRAPDGGEPCREPERIRKILESADLFNDWVTAPQDLQFCSETDFEFQSPIRSAWEENNRVYGRFFRCGEDWQSKPAVLLVHGWNGELGYKYQFPFLAWRLRRLDINTAMIELPYHGKRKPPRGSARRNFITNNLEDILEATRQAVADTRAALCWLGAQGCSGIGAWGISLGGWISGLVACTNQRKDFVVLTCPVVRMDRVIAELPFCEPIRRCLEGTQLGLDRLNLRDQKVRIDPENVLLVAPQYDVFAPRETLEELWEAWDHPEIWRVPHGHISVLMSLGIQDRTADWVAQRAWGAQENSS
jgi:pimeloyl-ACP methyl ester carboxylesterase